MPSLATAGLYSTLSVLLFSSTAMSLQNPHNASNSHRLFARDEWDDYDSVLSEFINNPTCSPGSGGGSADGDIMIAVASYINPLADPNAWNRLIGYPNSQVPILIANVVNGLDSAVDTSWQDVINRASAAGKIILGYVRTGYLGVSSQAFTTRLGSGNLADWTAQIEEDIDSWYRLYGNSMGGIFFDEGWPECGPGNIYHDLYKYINDYTKRHHPGAYTVLNPGSPMESCFEDTMDTLLTFELTYAAYTGGGYTPNDWTPKDPRKLWHIVYDVPESAISQVAALARQRGAGFLQMTDDTLPNPYDNMPNEAYMQAQIAEASGGTVLNTPASSWPSGVAVGGVSSVNIGFLDYSSANLVWPGVPGALGYNIYVDSKLAASVPPTMTSITIGGLQPGTSYSFYVTAIGGGGNEGPQSPTSQISTTALLDGSSITNLGFSQDGASGYYQADVLVPYAFVRLYLWDQVDCVLANDPAWPINFIPTDYVCTKYMVEGTTLYRYTGVIPPGSTNAPFAFTEVATVPVAITDLYTYHWTLPLNIGPADAGKYLVQGQGYKPFTNIFKPDKEDYDCKGSSLCGSFIESLCDAAQFNVVRNQTYTNQGSAADTGTCASVDLTTGCGLFIQGPGVCTISGDELWSAYEQIRKFGNCDVCGSWHRADGCLITINFVTGCSDIVV